MLVLTRRLYQQSCFPKPREAFFFSWSLCCALCRSFSQMGRRWEVQRVHDPAVLDAKQKPAGHTALHHHERAAAAKILCSAVSTFNVTI